MKIFNYSETKKNIIIILTLLWLVTLPLRNSVLTITVSGIEIYSNLIVTFFLSISLITSFRSFSSLQKIILFFLGGWVGFASVFLLITGISVEGIFDIHSLIMQFLFAFIVFGLSVVFEWDEFKTIIRNGLRFYLLLLLAFGFIEFFSLFHITGPNVAKLTEYPLASTFYAPFFIYDNNNDYCAYLALLIGFLYLFDDDLRRKNGLTLLLIFVLFFYARFAQSRLAEYVSYVYFIVFLFIVFIPVLKKKMSQTTLFFVLSFCVFILLIIFSNSFFNGKAYLKTPESRLSSLIVTNENLDTIVSYHKLESQQKQKLVQTFSKSMIDDNRSENIRMNLLKNGIDMIKKHPVLGEGPGSFRINHQENKFKYPTETVSNPHNFVIELIAQFGIWGWTYFGILIFLLIRAIRNKIISSDRKAVLIMLIVLYPFLGLIPSSFLYINLHWLFLPLIVCLMINSERQAETIE